MNSHGTWERVTIIELAPFVECRLDATDRRPPVFVLAVDEGVQQKDLEFEIGEAPFACIVFGDGLCPSQVSHHFSPEAHFTHSVLDLVDLE